jgi:nicotinate dehydrogenase subunit A
MPVELTINGETRTFDVDGETPLLYVLRNEAELNGPKFGCGLSQCGACTVQMDGDAVRSCVTPISDAEGTKVTTLSGLGSVDDPHPIQAAFIEEQAAQCGYCVSGMIMQSKALLDQNPDPSDKEIRNALEGNLCRCGTHSRILSAVKRAAENVE